MLLSNQNQYVAIFFGKFVWPHLLALAERQRNKFPAEFYCLADIQSDTLSTTLVNFSTSKF